MTVDISIHNHQTGPVWRKRHRNRKQQGDEMHTRWRWRWWWWCKDKMKQIRCSNGCSVLQAAVHLGDQSVLSSNTRLLDLSRLLSGSTLFSWGEGVWIWGEKVNKNPHYPVSTPQTQVCVCVCVHAWGVKALCLHSCLGSRPFPLPADVLRPGLFALSGTRWMSTGKEGRGEGVRRTWDCWIYLWWLCCEGCIQI